MSFIVSLKQKKVQISRIPNTTLKGFLFYLSRLKEELKIFNYSGVLKQQEDEMS